MQTATINSFHFIIYYWLWHVPWNEQKETELEMDRSACKYHCTCTGVHSVLWKERWQSLWLIRRQKRRERKTVKPDVYNLPKRENIMLPNPLQSSSGVMAVFQPLTHQQTMWVHVYHYLTKVIWCLYFCSLPRLILPTEWWRFWFQQWEMFYAWHSTARLTELL